MSKKNTLLGIVIAAVVAGILVYATYGFLSKQPKNELLFSENTMIKSLWEDYKLKYWDEQSGRTIDKQRNNITTSEGQSYTMLRSVWMSDRETFDKSWKWTKEQLQVRKSDDLFSWKWGQIKGDDYGLLVDEGGDNTASDGDIDIAMALIMAASRWQDDEYLAEAEDIIDDIWNQEVVEIDGTLYLAANDLEKGSVDKVIINPSYIAPYAFKYFAKIDTKHDWDKLTDDSYKTIAESMKAPLDNGRSANIPPNWAQVSKSTGKLSATADADLGTDYGFDAMRTSWRLALDYKWNKDERSKQLLQRMGFFSQQWKNEGVLKAVYKHNGEIVEDYESLALYGGTIGYFDVVEPELADDVYQKKLLSLYDSTDQGYLDDSIGYYDANWSWFGTALHIDQLPDLAKDLQDN